MCILKQTGILTSYPSKMSLSDYIFYYFAGKKRNTFLKDYKTVVLSTYKQ